MVNRLVNVLQQTMKAPLLLSLSLAATTSWAELYLNEIRLDQPGSDKDEYFEIFSTDPPNDSLADVALLVIGDGTGGSGVVENVTRLEGTALSSSYFLVAENTFELGMPDLSVSLNFENGDNVTYALVRGFTADIGVDLDTNDDGLLDLRPWSTLLDGVSLVESFEQPPTGTEWAYSEVGPQVGPDEGAVPSHIFRAPGAGRWNVGSPDPSEGLDTPGLPNVDVIPEPSSSALFLIGLAALLCRRRVR